MDELTPRFRVQLGEMMDQQLIKRVEALFGGHNLLETILHGHLLVERALTANIAEKLANPAVLQDAQWSFHSKILLYIGLCDPPDIQIRCLRSLNRLRNVAAHNIHDELPVGSILPWLGEGPPPSDPVEHARAIATYLLWDLGALKAMWRGDILGDDFHR